MTKLLKFLSFKPSLFETVIVAANDTLVELFLNNKIRFIDIQKRLFNPDSGVIVEVNKNTEFMNETQPKLKEVDEVVSWKGNVTKALWVVYSAIIGVIIKLLFWD